MSSLWPHTMHTSGKCKYIWETSFAWGAAQMIRCGVVAQRSHHFSELWEQQNGDREKKSKKVRERGTFIINTVGKEKKKNRADKGERVEEKSKRRRCVLIRDKEKEKEIGELNGDMRKHKLMQKKKQDLRRSLRQPFGFGERTRHPWTAVALRSYKMWRQ